MGGGRLFLHSKVQKKIVVLEDNHSQLKVLSVNKNMTASSNRGHISPGGLSASFTWVATSTWVAVPCAGTAEIMQVLVFLETEIACRAALQSVTELPWISHPQELTLQTTLDWVPLPKIDSDWSTSLQLATL